MAGEFISFLRDSTADALNQFVRLRAGAVSRDGLVLVLPSTYEPQLGALVVHIARRGWRLLSEELTLIDPVLRLAHALPLPLALDADECGRFPGLDRPPPARRSPRRSRGTPPRYVVGIDEVGAERGEPGQIRAFVFPTFERGVASSIETMPAAEALFRLAQAGLNLHVWGERGLILFRELIASTPAWRLRVGSLPDAAETVDRAGQRLMGALR
jgi:hypothetical protein